MNHDLCTWSFMREKSSFLRDRNLLVWRNSGFSYLSLLVNKVLTLRCTHLNIPEKLETNALNVWNAYNVQCATSSLFNIYIQNYLITYFKCKVPLHLYVSNSTARWINYESFAATFSMRIIFALYLFYRMKFWTMNFIIIIGFQAPKMKRNFLNSV